MAVAGSKIAWLGAGKMGGPMSRRLLAAEAAVTVYDPVPENGAAARAAGAALADTVAQAVDGAAVVFSMIPNDAALHAAALGPDGALAAMGEGTVYVDMSTVSPDVSAEVAAAAAERGIDYLRAPVSGSTALAESGSLTLMVSGPKAAFDRVGELFDVLGATRFYVGEDEQARYLKLVVNLLVGTTGAIMAEALTLGRKGGLDWQQMLDVIGVSAAASPYVKYNLDPLKARDFSPLFSAEQMVKDMKLITDAAQNVGAELDIAQAVERLFEATVAEGHGTENMTAAIRVVEKRAGLDGG